MGKATHSLVHFTCSLEGTRGGTAGPLGTHLLLAVVNLVAYNLHDKAIKPTSQATQPTQVTPAVPAQQAFSSHRVHSPMLAEARPSRTVATTVPRVLSSGAVLSEEELAIFEAMLRVVAFYSLEGLGLRSGRQKPEEEVQGRALGSG